MPRRELFGRDAEPLGEPRVGGRLPLPERLGRERVALRQRLEQPRLVHLGGRDREREPVAEAERPRGLVAQPRELAHVVGDHGADRLRRLPGLPPLVLVVARPEDLLDLVVVDGLAAHDAAMLGEPRLDGRLELDDPVAERLRHLLRDQRVEEDVELPRTSPSAPSARADSTARKSSGSAIASESASSASIRRCSFSLVASVFASHHDRAAASCSGRSRASASSTMRAASLTASP